MDFIASIFVQSKKLAASAMFRVRPKLIKNQDEKIAYNPKNRHILKSP
jgi:hypothetical protein